MYICNIYYITVLTLGNINNIYRQQLKGIQCLNLGKNCKKKFKKRSKTNI